MFNDGNHLCHMSRERTKASLNTLFIPNVGKDIIEYWQH